MTASRPVAPAIPGASPGRPLSQARFSMSSLYTRQAFGSARTHYLQRCLRRTGSDVTHVTCDCRPGPWFAVAW